MKVDSQKLDSGDLQITLTFDSHEQRCLEYELLSIVDWYSSGPSREKIYHCQKRMILENKEKLMASKEMQTMSVGEMNALMSDPVALCDAIHKMDGYKNRVQSEAAVKV